MNCDEVFVILTRGPFPSGDKRDRFVEAHLQSCADCQRLAEALRPNDEQRREAVAPEESLALPGYWGGFWNAERQPAVSVTQPLGYARPRRKGWSPSTTDKRGRTINVWQFTAAIALGIVLAAALRTLGSTSEAPPRRTIGSGSQYVGQSPEHSTRSNYEFMALDDLPIECQRSAAAATSFGEPVGFDGSPSLASPALASVAKCCTDCHRARGTVRIRHASMGRFHSKCVLCHD